MLNLEYRVINNKIEIREADDNKLLVCGYASVFDQETDLGYFKEIVRKGAFTNSLSKRNVVALWGHDINSVLGNTKSRTLSIVEDSVGLNVSVLFPESARDRYESIKRGDVDGMSFGFKTIKDQWNEIDDTNITRDLIEVELYEVSFTAFPAYTGTSAYARSAGDAYKEFTERHGNKNILAYYNQKLNLYRKD